MKTVKILLMTAIGVSMAVAGPVNAARPKPSASNSAAPAAAAAAPAPAAASTAAAAQEWTLKNTYGKWGVLCNQAKPVQCRAAQTQNYAETGNPGRLLQVLLTVEKGRTFAVMTLPFGVDLRAGIAVKVDEATEIKGVYTTCLPDGCQSILEFDENVVGQVRSGKTMKVGFRPWGGDDKTFVVEVPLEGAKEALAAIK